MEKLVGYSAHRDTGHYPLSELMKICFRSEIDRRGHCVDDCREFHCSVCGMTYLVFPGDEGSCTCGDSQGFDFRQCLSRSLESLSSKEIE